MIGRIRVNDRDGLIDLGQAVDIDQPFDDFRIALAAQVSNAVLGDHHVPQVLGYGGVTVKRHNIGLQLIALPPGAADTDNGTGTGQVV